MRVMVLWSRLIQWILSKRVPRMILLQRYAPPGLVHLGVAVTQVITPT